MLPQAGTAMGQFPSLLIGDIPERRRNGHSVICASRGPGHHRGPSPQLGLDDCRLFVLGLTAAASRARNHPLAPT